MAQRNRIVVQWATWTGLTVSWMGYLWRRGQRKARSIIAHQQNSEVSFKSFKPSAWEWFSRRLVAFKWLITVKQVLHPFIKPFFLMHVVGSKLFRFNGWICENKPANIQLHKYIVELWHTELNDIKQLFCVCWDLVVFCFSSLDGCTYRLMHVCP